MWVKVLLLFFVFSFLFRTDHSFDQDFGRHLKLGEIIWQTKTVPLTNLFSYTYPDAAFVNSHWLFEVLVYLGQQTTGLQFVLFLKIVFLMLSVWLVLKTIPKNQYLLLPIGFIFLHILRERPELRPEILSFLFTGLTIYILNKGKTRLIFVLPLIQLIWVNTHIYFFVGLSLQAIFLIHLAYQYLRSRSVNIKLPALIFLLSLIASMINPNGLKALFYPLSVNQNYGYTIVENQTMFFLEGINFKNPNFLFVKISALIILLSVVVALFKRRLSLKNLTLSAFGLALALINVRSLPYLALISLPATLENFGTAKSNAWHKLFILITIPILFYESFLYLNGDYYKYTNSDNKPRLEFKESGKGALDFVLKNNLPQPIFNNFDIGSYIIYRGYPKYPVFVDGRPEAYPKDFFLNTYIPNQYDYSKFKDLQKEFGFKTIIFSHTDQTPWGKAFLTSIVADEDFKTVYLDDFMIVLLNKDALLNMNIKPLDLADLEPSSYAFDSYFSYLRLALFLVQTKNLESAQRFAEIGLTLFPQSPLGNTLFGVNTQNKFFW